MNEQETTYQCHQCQDTHFVTWNEQIPGYPGPTLHSKPCPYCPAGVSLGAARDATERRRAGNYDDADRQAFAKRFTRLCVQFGKRPTRQLADAYWEHLRNYTDAEIERACQNAAEKCRFFPKISELIDLLHGGKAP